MIMIYRIIAATSYLFSVVIGATTYCDTLHLDYMRRQLEDFNSATPYTEEDGTKHTPYLEVVNGTATVTVGNGDVEGGVYHPMVASGDPSQVHWVNHIYVMDQNDKIIALKAMDPTDGVPAQFSFTVPEGVTQLTAYEFCNLHGLWKGPTFNTEGTGETGTTEAICMKSDVPPNSYESWHADFIRRQALPPFEVSEAYTPDGKHTPYITLNGSTGTVIVGPADNMHPMVGGDHENPPHWISDIYVVDQNEKIIAFQALDPNGVDIATFDFVVPESATELTAYEWCNIHGFWKGPTVQVNMEETPATLAKNSASLFHNHWIYVGCLIGSLFLVL